ncbi:Similar to gb/L13612 DEAD-box protein (dbp45A) from Drosophila melanogaster and is a member of PF/00270 DEAD/DEAH box helicase family [Arabidopsis thaliana]|jgi:ATP-dependent RNA helicase DDX49/DBP8|uniref:DEAD-box ATP-dependent RNA helicase 36 n=2 Tax=Arabidopsis thaliana TaxID=3702 RepID=RH36_ARATH|nr:RNA helicase 36 [Arabidopsis thaliana]Q9SA27.1 RecName: Full=DEAD-box ATP-dependent RNA helicase 36 [Arabidopsis thaliana]AAD34681.1 Similar to gb/L13612 DEAD-box protein (dbp45A) from Drosophila melanogaster and is a member of PF/00270 DEAD/DEAH box helicase family [Arabidopsis thaliana]AEE29431.1 RNA helicase 36 [Arabidopsis thaliana]|eukprot:NP_173078.1 RNA helicase 36 [Arabidopsis thaliana]
MEEPTPEEEGGITIMSKSRKNPKTVVNIQSQKLDSDQNTPQFEKFTNPNPSSDTTSATNFEGLGLAEWAVETCKELGMRKPTPVQTHCVPKILAGRDVLGLAQTGSGKTAAFALPILHRLAEDPYGVFALVVTPTRELAFQLAEQFKALGSCLNLRCSVIVGGMDMLTQTMSLVSRPHIVITTPGRIKVLLENNPDVPPVFSRTKFLVLDEADRVLDVGFQDELRTIFQCLPKSRQTLLFSATMTSNLQALLEHSSNKAYFYEAYEGLKTVDTLTQQFIFEDKDAKELYLVHILSQMEDKGIRSAMIFVSTCRTCQRLSLMLDELEVENIAMHSLNSQSMRLSALSKFKSGKVPILLATDVASRGLDIPTVDLVINYDIPRDPRDYVHRVGRTARAGRGGLAVSIITETDVKLIHKIEEEVGKKMEPYNKKVITDSLEVTKVSKAKRVAMMKMLDNGFEDKVKDRRKLKRKTLADKGLLKKRGKRQKSTEN